MAACSQPLNCFQIKGWAACVPSQGRFHVSENLGCLTERRSNRGSRLAPCSSYFRETVAFPSNELIKIDATLSGQPFDVQAVLKGFKMNLPDSSSSHAVLDSMQGLVVADLDPASAKIAISFLGPFLSAFSFLFILRIVMSWYPKLPVGKFPYVIAYAPTEPLLIPTRKVIPPLGGVDVTPVVWFGLVSFLNEILVGPQGLIVLLSQQVS